MATSGALAPFLNAMLQLRAQRLQEEEAKQRASQAGMSSLMSGITSGVGSLMGGISKMGENQAANKLMGEYFGGGGGPTVGDFSSTGAGAGAAQSLGNLSAADASAAPGAFTLPTTRTANRFTGGQAELENRMKLEQLRQTIGNARAADLQRNIANTRADAYLTMAKAREARDTAKSTFANQLFEQAPKDAQDIVKTALAYQAKTADLVEKQRKAMANNDFDAYQSAAQEHNSFNVLHTNKKMSTPMVPVEPYVSRDLTEKFATLAEAQAAAQGGGARQQRDLQTAQQDVRGEWMAPGATGLPANTASYGLIPPRTPPSTQLDPGMVNRVAAGAQFTQPEAQQITGMQPQPAAAPAPGIRPLTATGPDGSKQLYNHQTGQWEPMK